MLVYEKDNKLNINFDNKVDDSPDLSIGKSGDKTQILVDGQPSGGGGGGGANVLTLYAGEKEDRRWAYKNQECTEEYATFEEAVDAVNNASSIRVIMQPELGTQGTFFSNGFIVTDELDKAVDVEVLIGQHGSTTSYGYTLFEEFGET